MYSIKSCSCWSSVVVAATPLNLEWAFMRSSSTPQYRRLDLCAFSDTLVPIYHQCPAHRGTRVGAKSRQLMQCHDKCRISGSRQRRGRQAQGFKQRRTTQALSGRRRPAIWSRKNAKTETRASKPNRGLCIRAVFRGCMESAVGAARSTPHNTLYTHISHERERGGWGWKQLGWVGPHARREPDASHQRAVRACACISYAHTHPHTPVPIQIGTSGAAGMA